MMHNLTEEAAGREKCSYEPIRITSSCQGVEVKDANKEKIRRWIERSVQLTLKKQQRINGGEKDGLKMDFIDIRRAYFHAKARRNVFVNLPEED